jgi:hypothetical protein
MSMAVMCVGVMFPTQVVTRLCPVVAAPELLEENVADPKESVDDAFEGVSEPRHGYQSRKSGDV